MSQRDDTDDDGVYSKVTDWVGEAYFESVMARASAARTRAQTGFGIVSLIAGAVIAAILTGPIAAARGLTQILALLALFVWLVTAGLFMAALTQQPPDTRPTAEELARADEIRRRSGTPSDRRDELSLPPEVFRDYATRAVDREQLQVSQWILGAQYSTICAILLTFLTVASLLAAPRTARVTADVQVRQDYFNEFVKSCEVDLTGQTPPPHIVGRIDRGSLDDPFIRLDLGDNICRADV